MRLALLLLALVAPVVQAQDYVLASDAYVDWTIQLPDPPIQAKTSTIATTTLQLTCGDSQASIVLGNSAPIRALRLVLSPTPSMSLRRAECTSRTKDWNCVSHTTKGGTNIAIFNTAGNTITPGTGPVINFAREGCNAAEILSAEASDAESNPIGAIVLKATTCCATASAAPCIGHGQRNDRPDNCATACCSKKCDKDYICRLSSESCFFPGTPCTASWQCCDAECGRNGKCREKRE